ncbi:MAG: NUDIX hydrolase [Dehalococcoidia bacterium]|jgi:ADP-ribose pyrophosphatase|nr:NUDIX hydrolase [Dehalococcoidia bacterium]
MPEYRILSSSQIYTGRTISLRVDKVQLPSGKQTEREVVEHHGAVAIIALGSDGHVLLEKQFRHAAGKELFEIPAGGIDRGETPEETARRELQEEVGLFPKKLEHLCSFYSAPGFTNEYLHLFLATELTPSRLVADDTEEISIVKMSLPETVEMIRCGNIEDAKSITGLLYYLKFKAA